MRIAHLLFVGLIVGLLLIAQQTSGSILLEYDFSGEAGTQISTAASQTAAGLTASVFRRGFGLEPIAIADSIAARAWTSGEVETGLDYFEFMMAPVNGATLDINEIAFGERRNATGVRAFTLRSSLDGFVANLMTPFDIPDDGNTRGHALALDGSFDAISTPVTFRLYGYFSEAFVGRWAIANHPDMGVFRVSGFVTRRDSYPGDGLHAPEPASLMVWGIVGIVGAVPIVVRRWAGFSPPSNRDRCGPAISRRSRATQVTK